MRINRFILTIMLAASMAVSCACPKCRDNAAAGSAEPSAAFEAFRSFAEHFSETASFAVADIGGRQVLLVSQETFGSDEDTAKEAIEATLFAHDGKGGILCLGSVRSQGTLYPVSLLDGRIMVAGHQFVRIYGIRGDVPELVLDSGAEGDGPELDTWFRTFEKGTPVKFSSRLQ